MKYFTTPNSKNIIWTLCIVTKEKPELEFLPILYFHDDQMHGIHLKGIDRLIFSQLVSLWVQNCYTDLQNVKCSNLGEIALVSLKTIMMG